MGNSALTDKYEHRSRRKREWTVFSILGLVILVLFAAICIAPFIYMVLMSFTQSTTATLQLREIRLTDFSNYNYVFRNNGFLRSLWNSIVVVGFSCVLNCIIASMAAYGFEKKQFPGKEKLYLIYLATMMIPGQVTMIPIFLMMKEMKLLNTYYALIVLILNAFGVILIRQFMKGVPDDLIEAAQVDGCPEFRIYLNVVVPLIRPVLVSLVIFTFVTSWNDFMWPLISTSKSGMYTLTVALSLLKTQYATNYGLLMAGAAVSFVFPFVMYCILQKQFVEGIALSGIKG
ncbi:carbohydrate ABC transporter permease [Lachnoclostridium sp. Marseille-P6806]|uniref:carbohydrate ABC transporter permease n=1 Tax=Lachnoclostridium sp. Marseille-P6806 TaxID=2364793 RepID=UPI00102F7F05|nr:carbohydrate ABC transporter permease [Lachnoclostridium sp. Marseille-P6806]